MKMFSIKTFSTLIIAGLLSSFTASIAVGETEVPIPPTKEWSWTGIFGRFDKPAARRGFQIYSEVCSTCHSMNLLTYRNLEGLGFSKKQVKEIARLKSVPDDPNDQGDVLMRDAKPSDHFVPPFANKEAAIAANGALPPDLSLIIKSRNTGKHNFWINLAYGLMGRGTASGADYVYSLLTGFGDEYCSRHGINVLSGKYCNKYFKTHVISMPPPLDDDTVDYAYLGPNAPPATKEQLASDVVTFLSWASEPELETRKSTGVIVILFLLGLLLVVSAYKYLLWRDEH